MLMSWLLHVAYYEHINDGSMSTQAIEIHLSSSQAVEINHFLMMA